MTKMSSVLPQMTELEPRRQTGEWGVSFQCKKELQTGSVSRQFGLWTNSNSRVEQLLGMAQVRRQNQKPLRPFCLDAGVTLRSYLLDTQKAIAPAPAMEFWVLLVRKLQISTPNLNDEKTSWCSAWQFPQVYCYTQYTLKTERFYIKIQFFSTQKYQKVWSYEIWSYWSWLVGWVPLRPCSASVLTIPDCPPHHHIDVGILSGFLFHCFCFFQVLFNHMYFLTCICD